ncbi:MAG: hypothetical protein ACE5PV_07095 [Candidatus Poribacteria bacterium]
MIQKKCFHLITALILFSSLSVSSIAYAEEKAEVRPNPQGEYANSDFLADIDWLKANIDSKDVIIADMNPYNMYAKGEIDKE